MCAAFNPLVIPLSSTSVSHLTPLIISSTENKVAAAVARCQPASTANPCHWWQPGTAAEVANDDVMAFVECFFDLRLVDRVLLSELVWMNWDIMERTNWPTRDQIDADRPRLAPPTDTVTRDWVGLIASRQGQLHVVDEAAWFSREQRSKARNASTDLFDMQRIWRVVMFRRIV